MQASFWVQDHARRITVSDQQAVGVMLEVDERAAVLNEANTPVPKLIICLGKGEARAIASAIMGAAAEL